MSWRQRRHPPKPDRDQREFASSAALHPDYLASLERGERNPPLSTLHRLAAALKTTLNELIGTDPADLSPGSLIFCAGCDLADDRLTHAYRRNEPCPSCGLPAAVIEQVLTARRRAVGPYE